MPQKLPYNWPTDVVEADSRLSSLGIREKLPKRIDYPYLLDIIMCLVRQRQKSMTRERLRAMHELTKDLPGFRRRIHRMKRDLSTLLLPTLEIQGMPEPHRAAELRSAIAFFDWLDSFTRLMPKDAGYRFPANRCPPDSEGLRRLAVLDVYLRYPRPFPTDAKEQARVILKALKNPVSIPAGLLLQICNAIAFNDEILEKSRFTYERKLELAALRQEALRQLHLPPFPPAPRTPEPSSENTPA